MTLTLLVALLGAVLLVGVILVLRTRRMWLRVMGAALVLAPLGVAWIGYREIRAADRYIALCLDRESGYYAENGAFHPECGDLNAFR